jgi:transposase-like protein/transposase
MHKHHNNSKTNIHVRRLILENPDKLTARQIAQRFAVSPATVHKWTHRDELADASCRPKRVRTAFDDEEQKMLVSLRENGLSLDDILDQAEKVIPHATRSSIYRLLRRRNLGRIAPPAKDEHGTYDKGIEPGFLHIDSFKLIRVVGQSVAQVCFVAVDRATRQVLLAVYDHRDSEAACDFLAKCREYFSFVLHTIVTDNGAEYTVKASAPAKYAKGHRRPFELKCAEAGIDHRTTRPYTPKTNGLVERMNGEIKNRVIRNKKYQSIADRDNALRIWNEHYNRDRKNRNIPIGRMTPLEAAAKWFEKNPAIFNRQPLCTTLAEQICSQPPET